MNHGRAMNSIKQNDWNVLRWRHNESDDVTGVSIVCLAVCSSVDKRKHQSSASLAFVGGIYRWPADSPQEGPVSRKMLPFDDVIMKFCDRTTLWFVPYMYHTMDSIYRFSAKHMMTSSSGNIFRVTGHLCGEFTGLRWIPRTKASDVEWSFDVFFDLCPNKRLSKQSWGWWFETPSGWLWRHSNDNIESMVHVWYKT